jgi:RHS repeat-associated protein
MDGLGHPIEKELTTDPEGTIYTATPVDGLGRTYTSSNPYRSSSDPTYGITTYKYDALGRTVLVIPPDGTSSNNNISTQYCGPTTLVTDQAGHWRRSKSDAFGRLVEVDEPNSTTATVNVCPGTGEPIWVTKYTYDGLDDLLSVAQGGSHNRSFIYDSLKRLTSSTNPETGPTTPVVYTYDANGNVSTKKDGRGTASTISYSYDDLNRSIGRTYSNGDSSVSYAYDQATCVVVSTCYNIGRRTSMSDAGGSESWAYDKMGREWGEKRTTNGLTKTTGYTYDLSGDLATLTYPSGRTVTYTTDYAGRPSDAQDVANNIAYIEGPCPNGTGTTGACYAPQGAVSVQTFGPSTGTYVNYEANFNNRLQPNTIGIFVPGQTTFFMRPIYNFVDANGHNNGNVISISNYSDSTRSQQFTYDQVNRLLTATASTYATSPAHCWGEAYVYDNATTGSGEYGNLTNINVASTAYNGCTQDSLSVVSNANNQITSFSYDGVGNVLNDTHNSYLWNAESEIKTAAGVNYTYDGDGNRLQKSNGKIYWYGAGTQVLDESDRSGNITDEYVFFGGQRVSHRVVSSNTLYFYGGDMLGSSRTVFTSAGVLCYDADFSPWGAERAYTNTCASNYKFEGKERDAETNNDNFGARYYSSAFGRWASPDWAAKPSAVPYAIFGNPQSLNLYGFVGDNPLSRPDLDGHTMCSPPQACYDAMASSLEKLRRKVQDGSTNSSPVVAGVKTFIVGFLTDTAKLALSPLTIGTATGTCMGGNGCSKTETAKAVGGDLLKAAAIALPAAKLAGAAAAADEAVTAAGDTFTHYGYLADSDNFAGGLRPGSFATTESDLTGSEAQSGLALPNRPALGPPDAAYPVAPEPGTPIVGPSTVRPAFGQPGGLTEVQFPNGTGPGTVGTPKPIPPE